MGPKEQIEAAFGAGKTLYEILGVARDANPAAVRKAYFKMALTCVRTLWFMGYGAVLSLLSRSTAVMSLPACPCVDLPGDVTITDTHTFLPHPTHPKPQTSTRTSAKTTRRRPRNSRRSPSCTPR